MSSNEAWWKTEAGLERKRQLKNNNPNPHIQKKTGSEIILKTSPKKLKSLLSACMLPKSRPMFDPIALNFTTDGILCKQNHGDILAVYNTFKPSYFEMYEGSGTDHIPHIILETLKSYREESVTLKIINNRWYLDDGFSHNDDMIYDKPEEVIFPGEMVESEYGYAPKNFKPEFSVVIDAKQLQLPNMNTVTFDFKDKRFTVVNPKVSNFFRLLNITKIIEHNPIHRVVDVEYLNIILKQLKGDIYIAFERNVMLLSKKEEDYTQTYLLAMMMEED